MALTQSAVPAGDETVTAGRAVDRHSVILLKIRIKGSREAGFFPGGGGCPERCSVTEVVALHEVEGQGPGR